METATATPKKKIRFDTSDDNKVPTPIAAAKDILQANCASLLPELAKLLSPLGRQHLLDLQKLCTKSAQLEKFRNDESFIPRSARVKFALTASTAAEANDGYLRLQEETKLLVTDFQQSLKTKIVALTQIESNLLLSHIQETFASTIHVVVQSFLICSNLVPADLHKVVNTLLANHSADILPHLQIDLESFRTIYRRVHTLAFIPGPFNLNRHLPADGILRDNAVAQAPAILPPTFLLIASDILPALLNIFVVPWQTYLNTQRQVTVDTALRALRVDHLELPATDAAARLVEAEPAADPPQLKAIIASQVRERTSKLQKELTTLRNQLSQLTSKNVKRGLPISASKKKKSIVPEAEEVVSATSTASKKKQGNKSPSKTVSKHSKTKSKLKQNGKKTQSPRKSKAPGRR